MDPIISSYPHQSLSDDLFIAADPGIVYQKDMTQSVAYDQSYFDNYVNLEGKRIAQSLNQNRAQMVQNCHCVLDIGIGSGEFMRSCGKRCYGFDINEVAVDYLLKQNSFIDPFLEGIPDAIDCITMWDAMEHMRRPSDLLTKPRVGVQVSLSLPIFADITRVKESKHYKPNEHYYYYTERGIRQFFHDLGYRHLNTNDGEIRAGREGILSFSFIRERLVDVAAIVESRKPRPVPTVVQTPPPAAPQPVVKEVVKEAPKPEAKPAPALEKPVATPVKEEKSKPPFGFTVTGKPVKGK